MSDMQTIIFGGMLRDLVLLAVFVWLPIMNKERAFFGVRVEPSIYQGKGRQTLHRYWLTLLGIFVVSEVGGLFLATSTNKPILSVLTSLAATGAAFVIYCLYAQLISPYAVASVATRFASPIQARSLKNYTHWWLEVAIFALTAAAFAISAYYYGRIPARMPVHWNAAGTADGWAQKSFAGVFFLSALNLYLQIFFLVLKHDLAHARITLPGVNTVEFLRGKERHLLANIQMVDWSRIAIGLLFGIVSLLIISTTVSELNHFTKLVSVSVWITLAVMLTGMGYFLWRMKRVNDELKTKFGESYIQRQVEEAHWRQGGLAYYNPDDPALVVEKLVGFGYTLNLAHPGIRSRLALLLGTPLFIVWALLSF